MIADLRKEDETGTCSAWNGQASSQTSDNEQTNDHDGSVDKK